MSWSGLPRSSIMIPRPNSAGGGLEPASGADNHNCGQQLDPGRRERVCVESLVAIALGPFPRPPTYRTFVIDIIQDAKFTRDRDVGLSRR